MELVEMFTTLGSTLGITATLILFYLVLKVKELSKRQDKLELDNKTSETALSDIRANVAYIRGKIDQL